MSKFEISNLGKPLVWKSLQLRVIFLFLVRSNETSAYQFNYKSSNYPNVDIYFNAFNFYSNEIIFTSNSALVRTASSSGTYARVYSVGGLIISYINESLDAEAYSQPIPCEISQITSPNVFKSKLAPDGKALFLSPSNSYQIRYPPIFDQLIIYPLGIPGLIFTSSESTPQYESNLDFAQVDNNLAYFSLGLIRLCSQFDSPRKTLMFGNSIDIDTIFGAASPVVGNESVYMDEDLKPYKIIKRNDLINFSLDDNGNPIQASDSSAFYDLVREHSSPLLTPRLIWDSLDFSNAPQFVFVMTGGIFVKEVYTQPFEFLGINRLYWENVNNMTSFKIPTRSISIPTMFKILTDLSISAPSSQDNVNYDALFSALGPSTSIYKTNTTTTCTQFVNFNRVTGIYPNVYYLTDDVTNVTAKNNEITLFLLLNFIVNSIEFNAMENKSFEKGMRMFSQGVDLKQYYQIRDYHDMQIRIKIDGTNFSFVEGFRRYGPFQATTIIRDFKEISMCMLLPFINVNEKRETPILYTDLARRLRSQLRPCYIYNAEESFIMWQPFIYSPNFYIFSNDLLLSSSFSNFVDVFIMLR